MGPRTAPSQHGYEVTASGCWLLDGRPQLPSWTASREAHRVFILLRGPVPARTVLVRTCETPGCVNPEHLEPRTPASVAQRSGRAKLVPADVAQIRLLRAQGRPRGEVAEIFGVHPTAVSHICAGRRWRWIA